MKEVAQAVFLGIAFLAMSTCNIMQNRQERDFQIRKLQIEKGCPLEK